MEREGGGGGGGAMTTADASSKDEDKIRWSPLGLWRKKEGSFRVLTRDFRVVAAGGYRGSAKMDVHGGARGRHSAARLHVQDPGRYDDRRRRRSQASQPRGTGPSHRSQVRDLSDYR